MAVKRYTQAKPYYDGRFVLGGVIFSDKGDFSLTDSWEESLKGPVKIWTRDSKQQRRSTVKSYYLYKGVIYQSDSSYSEADTKLLIRDLDIKEQRKLEKIRSTAEAKNEVNRQAIPERVRNEVWRRDEGKCRRCGSNQCLEFDHVIPVSKGGSNTARNIELLCESCNRTKSNHIG